ncbi:MAG: hypothetical protein HQ518_28510 [Rhodopirellula sp.]|nr:hypothetical protein [Rhodopirellula sp.]
MFEPLLTILNRHSLGNDDPPIVDDGDTRTYIGYSENRFGEQWIFLFNRSTGEAILRGGDIGRGAFSNHG